MCGSRREEVDARRGHHRVRHGGKARDSVGSAGQATGDWTEIFSNVFQIHPYKVNPMIVPWMELHLDACLERPKYRWIYTGRKIKLTNQIRKLCRMSTKDKTTTASCLQTPSWKNLNLQQHLVLIKVHILYSVRELHSCVLSLTRHHWGSEEGNAADCIYVQNRSSHAHNAFSQSETTLHPCPSNQRRCYIVARANQRRRYILARPIRDVVTSLHVQSEAFPFLRGCLAGTSLVLFGIIGTFIQ